MAVVGIETLIIQELIMQYFKDFSKIKFSRILASLGTDKQQLNLPISYPLTT
jgi:hypothetical protein